MDGFSRILEKKGGGLLCTRLYIQKIMPLKNKENLTYIHKKDVSVFFVISYYVIVKIYAVHKMHLLYEEIKSDSEITLV